MSAAPEANEIPTPTPGAGATAPPPGPSALRRATTFLTKYAPVFSAIAASAVIIGLVFSAGRWLLSAPPLAVQVTVTDVAYPPRIVGAVQKQLPYGVLRELAKGKDTLWKAVAGLDDFLRQTDRQMTIAISNNTSRSLTNLDVRISGVEQATGWSYGGDVFTRAELDRLTDSTKYESGAQVLRLPVLQRIPPKRTLNIYLWGKFPDYYSFDRERVEATYDGGVGVIVPQETVTGKDAFVYRNGGFILLMILVANAGYWLIRRAEAADMKVKLARLESKEPTIT